MFDDDLLLFGQASNSNIQQVLGVLDTFCKMSGQVISAEKTSIYFSKNVFSQLWADLANQSGFKEVGALGRYTGAPLLGKSPKGTSIICWRK